jgi:hypothetical protein
MNADDLRDTAAAMLGRPLTTTEGQCVLFGASMEAQHQQLRVADRIDMRREAELLGES